GPGTTAGSRTGRPHVVRRRPRRAARRCCGGPDRARVRVRGCPRCADAARPWAGRRCGRYAASEQLIVSPRAPPEVPGRPVEMIALQDPDVADLRVRLYVSHRVYDMGVDE